jgi:hypothetical protein
MGEKNEQRKIKNNEGRQNEKRAKVRTVQSYIA